MYAVEVHFKSWEEFNNWRVYAKVYANKHAAIISSNDHITVVYRGISDEIVDTLLSWAPHLDIYVLS
jgi:hypothetical protein